MSCKNCVFVVGIDKKQIKKIFQQKFDSNDEKRGLEYIEKFVQLEFDLPPKTVDEVKEFLSEHASQQLQASPKTIELIAKFIEPNPRKIKRWLNSVLFLEKLFKVKQEKVKIGGSSEIDLSLASIWLFLKSFFPDFARLVENDPSILGIAIEVAGGKGSKEDKEKIGGFTIDKRLAEFLSLVKPGYNLKLLRELVYLSKLTPVLDVSTVPKDILKRIAEMTEEELEAQLKMLGEEGALPFVARIIDNLIVINNYEQYIENKKSFELLDHIFEKIDDEDKKVAIIEKIYEFIQSPGFGYTFFMPRFSSYTNSRAVQARLV